MRFEALSVVATEPRAVPCLVLIPLLPLLGAALNGLLGKPIQDRFGRRAVHAIAVGAMLGSAAVSLWAVLGKLVWLPASERLLHDRVYTILELGQLRADFALTIDPLSAVMVLI